MKLLQCIESMDPRLGGTVEATGQISRALKRLGVDVEILALDSPSVDWGEGFGCRIHRLGPPKTFYRYAPRLSRWLRQRLGDYQTAIINGVWRHHSVAVSTAARVFGIPYFVIPHSMLNPWFRHAYPLKHLRKSAYWRLAEHRTLRDAKAVIYTSEEERRLSHAAFHPYRCREQVLALGTADPRPFLTDYARGSIASRFPRLAQKRLLLFLGRLHPVKAPDLLLRASAKVLPRHPDVHLVIAGPDSNGWQGSLKNLSNTLGLQDSVTFTGPVYAETKWGLFSSAELLILPSHCEAFPYAVLEALGCGLGVLVTNKVNIHRELARDQCALIAEDTVDDVASSMTRWLEMTDGQRQTMRRNARACFETRFTVDGVARRLADLVAPWKEEHRAAS